MFSKHEIESELQKLHDSGFLMENESILNIRNDLHSSHFWADVFWRRRKNHANRDDPEIQFIFDNNPTAILEIGTAYGRVLNKITIENEKQIEKAQLFGIEVCKHCKKYFQAYSKENLLLENCDVFFDDFLKNNNMYQRQFDVIVLPMNTFPSLPISMLKEFFSAVRRQLNPNGLFIFSTYKPKATDNKFNSKNLKGDYSGELLIEPGNDIIASEHYLFPAVKKDYGMQAITYSSYNRLTREYELEEREIYRNTRNFINPDKLKEIIKDNDFHIKFIDTTSHSAVYCLQ
ncbi:MAG: methyltransferase domain-containing protein [Candidatus Heimdallarchaeota archaeon]|nr:methyltransferase domain-containing protein [Candidatus Heimdallarchaeota archaeon]